MRVPRALIPAARPLPSLRPRLVTYNQHEIRSAWISTPREGTAGRAAHTSSWFVVVVHDLGPDNTLPKEAPLNFQCY